MTKLPFICIHHSPVHAIVDPNYYQGPLDNSGKYVLIQFKIRKWSKQNVIQHKPLEYCSLIISSYFLSLRKCIIFLIENAIFNLYNIFVVIMKLKFLGYYYLYYDPVFKNNHEIPYFFILKCKHSLSGQYNL